MTEPTGYRESPDTTDGPVAEGQTGNDGTDEARDGSVTLTTDDEAQHDDGIVRPGNTPD